MKKLVCLLLLLSSATYAQPGPKWSTSGNSANAGDVIGTTNNQPLNIITNNNIRMVLDTNGQFQILNLAGVGNRFLKVDANGSLISFPNGNATDVLYGNGSWGALPNGATSWQLVGNNLLSTNTGNIGIGTNNPTFKLDIVGSVRISSNLFVGGGIITTSIVNSTSQLNAGDINATNNMNVAGSTTLTGPVTVPALGTGSINIYKPLFVDNVGNMIVGPNPPEGVPTGCQPLNPSWKIGGNTILGSLMNEWTAGTCDNYPFILKSNNVPKIWLTNTANNGYIGFGTPVPSERYHFSSGNVLIDDLNAGGSAFRMKILAGEQPGFAVETNHTLDDNYNTRLKVNRNGTKALSVINTFADVNGLENFLVYGDGKTNVGWQPGSPNSAKLNVNTNGNDAFNIFNQPTNQICFSLKSSGVTEIVTNVANSTDDIFTIRDGTQPNTPAAFTFKIKKNGKTTIGNQTQINNHANALLTVNGKIAAREVIVTVQDWFDYVLEPEYQLPSWEETENYFKINKHLKDVPTTKEVLADGVDIGKTQGIFLKKLEESYLYLSDFKKENKQKELQIAKLKEENVLLSLKYEELEKRLIKLENK